MVFHLSLSKVVIHRKGEREINRMSHLEWPTAEHAIEFSVYAQKSQCDTFTKQFLNRKQCTIIFIRALHFYNNFLLLCALINSVNWPAAFCELLHLVFLNAFFSLYSLHHLFWLSVLLFFSIKPFLSSSLFCFPMWI